MLRVSASLVLALLASGCGASMSADARMDAELSGQAHSETDATAKGEVAERDRPLTQQEQARAQSALIDEAPSVDFALFGARHDFTVKDGSGAVACKCVSALLGPPSSGKLAWSGEMPKTKPETQLVVALLPASGECSGAPAGSGGASYWGYRIEGNDVVVLLEDWKTSRPRTLGAIIPKPAVGGQVYLSPVSSKLPYGTPANGPGARCALGNPGPQRNQPLTPAEAETPDADAGSEDGN
jgi:hypothetical protein